MDGIINPQGVGKNYDNALFKKSQAIGLDILKELKEKIQPGMTEKDARDVYALILSDFGVQKNWHPSKIRFGPNTIKSFREISDETYQLKEDDIFFLDLGPIIEGHEADVGRTFTTQKNSNDLHKKIIADGEEIFHLTRDQFLKHKLNGPALYAFAENIATQRGWKMVGDGANGHRIGDFPHQVFYKGNLRSFDQDIIPDLWILEIQLRSPDLTFGCFYEDVL